MCSPVPERSAAQLLSAALLLLWLSGCSSMDVIMPQNINALNGTTVKIPCTFTSCYKMDVSKFLMNWTYQETLNDTEDMVVPPPRDSTIAVAIGASVGGALALLILSMVVVKCLRRHRKQELISEEKMEEEGKLDPEGVAEEGTKHLPEDL
ncbi:sodium channel regulatory subunit beta-2 [Notothenia coriiceps]|uniref:Sodium channel regulatory subunit beta-2 n=1 Tax=Notothenia coriiceps TaxID=8208 RepID=A0A6I9PS51_9TELE|nr:PREDICTED: sodium channel subunit beta-2 [Notothenia coriiceps]